MILAQILLLGGYRPLSGDARLRITVQGGLHCKNADDGVQGTTANYSASVSGVPTLTKSGGIQPGVGAAADNTLQYAVYSPAGALKLAAAQWENAIAQLPVSPNLVVGDNVRFWFNDGVCTDNSGSVVVTVEELK